MAKDHKAGTILAFLVGIGIGAAAVLVLAPQAGDELRDNITDAIGDSVDQLRDGAKDFTQRSQKVVETAKEQVQDVVDQGTDAFKQAKKAGA
ncbi:MAG: YtxH domain-containing protein [Candidatus Acidiferrales bacterium]